jgi:hypothetical protein
LAAHFSWAVPSEEAIDTVARHTQHVVEIGGGSGYWAWLMAQRGISVRAFDVQPPAFMWHPVEAGDERAVLQHPGRTLFLCWPPYGSLMAVRALSWYGGDLVVYVGEWRLGCAEPLFFTTLDLEFAAVESVAIPQWFARDDRLYVFRRRAGGVRRLQPIPPTGAS